MTDNPPYQRFAKQFMEQWQQQMAGTINDRDLVQSMLEMMQQTPFSAMAGYGNTEKTTASNTSEGFAATAGADDVSVAELVRRLAYCEARIARLESQLEPDKPAKRKPAAAKRSGAGTSTRKRSTAKTRPSTKRD